MRTNNGLRMLLLCGLVLSGCATQVPPASIPVEVSPPKLPPAPANVMVERPASFRQRLLEFFQQTPVGSSSTSPTKPTTLPASSPPASGS